MSATNDTANKAITPSDVTVMMINYFTTKKAFEGAACHA